MYAATFDENIKSYVVTMPSGTKRIDFEYEICKNCEISISGNDNLKEGLNEIVIKIKNIVKSYTKTQFILSFYF